MAEGYINLAPLYDAIRGVSRQVDKTLKPFVVKRWRKSTN